MIISQNPACSPHWSQVHVFRPCWESPSCSGTQWYLQLSWTCQVATAYQPRSAGIWWIWGPGPLPTFHTVLHPTCKGTHTSLAWPPQWKEQFLWKALQFQHSSSDCFFGWGFGGEEAFRMYSSSLPGGAAGSGSWSNPFARQGPHFCLFLLNLDLIGKASGWSLSAMAGSLPSQQVDTVHMCQGGRDLRIRSRHLSVDIGIASRTESCLHNSLGREGC